MVWVLRVVKARLFLKLTSHSFLEGSKLYSLLAFSLLSRRLLIPLPRIAERPPFHQHTREVIFHDEGEKIT